MTTGKAAGSNLRERKKLAAREALSWAALRLATERGLEHVRVEDIAAEVGVSARTFNNYFSSKEEAICAVNVDRQLRVRDALRSRPASEPIWDAMKHAIIDQYTVHGEPTREWISRGRMMMSNPSLIGEFLKSHAVVERILAEEIAERTGTDTERDLYPHLMATAVVSAVRVAIDHCLNSDLTTPFAGTITRALEQLAAGLPTPAPSGGETNI